MTSSYLTLVGLLLVASRALAAEANVGEAWAGHQVIAGKKDVAFVGEVVLRTDTFMMARAERTEAGVQLIQWICAIDMSPVGGAISTMSRDAAWRLPAVSIDFTRQNNGHWRAAPWIGGWDALDHDADGSPGVTVHVAAPLCGGNIYVASAASNEAEADLAAGGMTGNIKVNVSQTILGTSNMCLGWAASDSYDHFEGRFAYVKVADDVTCATLLAKDWPVRVSSP